MSETATYDNWEEFLGAVSSGELDVESSPLVTVEYDSVYSDAPQTVSGAMDYLGGLGLAFEVGDRRVKGWHVRSPSERKIGRVRRVEVEL